MFNASMVQFCRYENRICVLGGVCGGQTLADRINGKIGGGSREQKNDDDRGIRIWKTDA